jgi:hypothetical protein
LDIKNFSWHFSASIVVTKCSGLRSEADLPSEHIQPLFVSFFLLELFAARCFTFQLLACPWKLLFVSQFFLNPILALLLFISLFSLSQSDSYSSQFM